MSKQGNPGLVRELGQIYRLKNREKKQKPRPLCAKCKSPVYAVRIDRGQQKKPKPRKGRPKENQPERKPRYELIGYWCGICAIFYYLDGRMGPSK